MIPSSEFCTASLVCASTKRTDIAGSTFHDRCSIQIIFPLLRFLPAKIRKRVKSSECRRDSLLHMRFLSVVRTGSVCEAHVIESIILPIWNNMRVDLRYCKECNEDKKNNHNVCDREIRLHDASVCMLVHGFDLMIIPPHISHLLYSFNESSRSKLMRNYSVKTFILSKGKKILST